MKSWPDVAIPNIVNGLEIPTLFLTNSKSMQLEALPQKTIYRMYVCGITPYDATHLGHAATYLTFDLINRYLRATGAEVSYVQNITDIDDPLLERAARDNVNWEQLATSQIDLFRSDMVNLRILPPRHYIGAVEAIDLVSDAVTALEKAGTIYSIEKDLYFKNFSSSGFGQLSHLNQLQMQEIFSQRGGDPTLPGKINPLDCLVWMAQRPNEPGWNSPHGFGRPGWHIECTAIALKYLEPDIDADECIDIQGGGSDLIFPHHEMCASQAHVLTGKELAKTYVHSAMIGLDGEKMSKSKGNLVFVSTLVNSGVDPMVIRFALMSQHYRQDRMWSDSLLQQASKTVTTIKTALNGPSVAPTQPVIEQIVAALSQDLNTPLAFETLEQWANESIAGATGGVALELRQSLDALLGLDL
ncbi:MAG: cysteine--1-D-myo-inosityl 2-amino-2-deoxy-alpha-D-glucopyranoside ligase [Actinomycetes bacterium]